MKKYIVIGIAIFVAAVAGVAFWTTSHPNLSSANPGFFSYSPCYIDGLSSTRTVVKQLQAGRASSTIGSTTLCDVTAGNNTVPLALNLTLYHEASSSAVSAIDFYVQTSMDGTNWSDTPLQTFTSVTATTSQVVFSPRLKYTYFQAASTTDLVTGLVNGTTTVNIKIPNPDRARYFKVLIFAPFGTQNSNIWAELRPVKESN